MTSSQDQPSRRRFLRTAGLAGAGAAAIGPLSALTAPTAAAATAGNAGVRGRWQPDPDSPRFTIAVLPDTQYLFDDDRVHPEPLYASFEYLLDHAVDKNIVFMAHLGDLTEDGLSAEIGSISTVFRMLDQQHVDYSVLCGNHDVNSNTTDQRGSTPYLEQFPPSRFKHSRTFLAATPDGYNTAHRFRAAGRDWLLLAMDWRPSDGGFAWANHIIAANPHCPVILTTHELVDSNDDGTAGLSDFGQQVWDKLISHNDQVFLTLNGHFWPPGRTTIANTAGHDVHLHITNYQNRYYGGAAMIRLYHFDTARNTIDVETISPWIMRERAEQRNLLASQEVELTGDVDYFSVPVDFTTRFAGFAPVPPRPARPASQLVIPGTLAYWRFDGHADGSTAGPAPDLSGNHNDMTTLTTVPGTAAGALTYTADHHPDQPGHGSLRFTGGQNPLHGAWLQTGPNAPLNTATFEHGYTFEAFFKIPADFDSNNNSWQALLSRWGMSSQANKRQGDPQEPIVTLSLSDDHGLQWCVYPLNQTGSSTNWGHELPLDTWWHVAVVNDGQHTIVYVDGCPVVRNPATPAVGLTQLGLPWLLGGYEYGGSINQIFNGWLGDVRIVNKALAPKDFMIGN